MIFTIIVFALLVTLDEHSAFNKGNTFTVVGEFSSVLWVSNRGGLPRLQSRRTTTGCPKKVTIGMRLEPLAGTPRVWKLFLRFLVYQNTALFSTFRPPSVTGVTSQLVSIIWWFRPWNHIYFGIVYHKGWSSWPHWAHWPPGSPGPPGPPWPPEHSDHT